MAAEHDGSRSSPRFARGRQPAGAEILPGAPSPSAELRTQGNNNAHERGVSSATLRAHAARLWPMTRKRWPVSGCALHGSRQLRTWSGNRRCGEFEIGLVATRATTSKLLRERRCEEQDDTPSPCLRTPQPSTIEERRATPRGGTSPAHMACLRLARWILLERVAQHSSGRALLFRFPNFPR